MRKLTGILVLLAVLVLLAGCATQTTTQQQTQTQAQEQTAGEKTTVMIKDYAFNPKDVIIQAGAEVEWTNQDSVIHDVTTEFFDHDINPGESFSYTFETAGTYEYHCDIHQSMTGTITVQ